MLLITSLCVRTLVPFPNTLRFPGFLAYWLCRLDYDLFHGLFWSMRLCQLPLQALEDCEGANSMTSCADTLQKVFQMELTDHTSCNSKGRDFLRWILVYFSS